MTRRHRRANGQAMTEVLICASFLLVPLLLIIPMIGKFIEMKHAAIQTARYEAWEYTVWYHEDCERSIFGGFSGPIECPMGGFIGNVQQPIKPRPVTQRESRQRFLSTTSIVANDGSGNQTLTGLPISNADGTAGWQVPQANQTWRDHRGTLMYNGAAGINGADIVSSGGPGDGSAIMDIVTDVIGVLLDVVSLVFQAMGLILSIGGLGGDQGFDAINKDGWARSSVTVNVNTPAVTQVLGTVTPTAGAVPVTNLAFTGRAGVLTDGWNSGGLVQTTNQAGGAVPSTLLKNLFNLPGLSQVWDLIGALAPELRRCNQGHILLDRSGRDPIVQRGSLWFGHVDIDAVHRSRLGDRDRTHTCDDAGRCDFDDTFTRERRCVPD